MRTKTPLSKFHVPCLFLWFPRPKKPSAALWSTGHSRGTATSLWDGNNIAWKVCEKMRSVQYTQCEIDLVKGFSALLSTFFGLLRPLRKICECMNEHWDNDPALFHFPWCWNMIWSNYKTEHLRIFGDNCAIWKTSSLTMLKGGKKRRFFSTTYGIYLV